MIRGYTNNNCLMSIIHGAFYLYKHCFCLLQYFWANGFDEPAFLENILYCNKKSGTKFPCKHADSLQKKEKLSILYNVRKWHTYNNNDLQIKNRPNQNKSPRKQNSNPLKAGFNFTSNEKGVKLNAKYEIIY